MVEIKAYGKFFHRHIVDIPWTPLKRPLTESCLAIVSTAGFFLEDDEPFDIDSAKGDASFRTIPSNFTKEKLKIAHTHYPHARVKEDINVLFPNGASFGEPHNRLQQMTILRDLLLLLQTASEPGIFTDLPYKWRRSIYEEVTWDSFIANQKD